MTLEIIRFDFLVSIGSIIKLALFNRERDVVKPKINAQRNGRDA